MAEVNLIQNSPDEIVWYLGTSENFSVTYGYTSFRKLEEDEELDVVNK